MVLLFSTDNSFVFYIYKVGDHKFISNIMNCHHHVGAKAVILFLRSNLSCFSQKMQFELCPDEIDFVSQINFLKIFRVP